MRHIDQVGGILINVPKILLAVLYIIILPAGHKEILVMLMLAIVAYDIIDGKLIWWRESLVRRLSDNICDKLVVNLIGLATLFCSGLTWMYPPFLLQTLILAVGTVILTIKGVVVFPNYSHKIAVLFMALLGITILYWQGWYIIILWSVVCLVSFIAVFDYIGIYLVIRECNFPSGRFNPKLFMGIKKLLT